MFNWPTCKPTLTLSLTGKIARLDSSFSEITSQQQPRETSHRPTVGTTDVTGKIVRLNFPFTGMKLWETGEVSHRLTMKRVLKSAASFIYDARSREGSANCAKEAQTTWLKSTNLSSAHASFRSSSFMDREKIKDRYIDSSYAAQKENLVSQRKFPLSQSSMLSAFMAQRGADARVTMAFRDLVDTALGSIIHSDLRQL